MSKTWAAKDPDERLDYQHNWEPAFSIDGQPDTDTVLGLDAADPADRPSATVDEGDVVVDDIVVNGNKIQYWLSGGTDGTACKLTLQVTTTQGRILQQGIKLKIKSV